MIDSISTAIEVAQRPGKVFLVLVEVNSPTSFYQIITVPSSRIRNRLNKYLPNARTARHIGDNTEILGRIHLLGFQDKSEFNNAKTLFRKIIGPENQPMLNAKISSVKPKETTSIPFTHTIAEGLNEIYLDGDPVSSIHELLKVVSKLEIKDWLGQ
jgi:hypothetical protein